MATMNDEFDMKKAMDIWAQKSAWRRSMRQRLAAITAQETARQSQLVCAQLRADILDRGEEVIAAFLALEHEIDLAALICDPALARCRIYVPRVVARDMPLSWAPVPLDARTGEAEQMAARLRALGWRTDHYGILEPPESNCIHEAPIDYMIMPSLAVDRRGTRLGHGAGYYDRSLARLAAAGISPHRVAACLDAQMIADELPHAPYDIAVHAAIGPEQRWEMTTKRDG